MPDLKLALIPGEPKRLELSWKSNWKDFTIRVDGQVIGMIPDEKALKKGLTFSLPDGSTLAVGLKSIWVGTELEVLRNGMPVPGSATDPETQLRGVVGILYFVAILSAVIGTIAALFRVEFLLNLGMGIPSVVFGVIFGWLGYFTGRRSIIALGLAIALFAADGIYSIIVLAQESRNPPMGAIIVRVLLLAGMCRGFPAIRRLRSVGTK